MQKIAIFSLVLLAALLGLHYSSTSVPDPFQRYQQEYSKVYSKQGQEQFRRYVFLKNVQAIQNHNAEPNKTYTQGINQFTDMTAKELQALYLTLRVPEEVQAQSQLKFDEKKVKENIDWRAAGKLSRVGDQGQCGNSWAFSATSAIESLFIIQKRMKEFDLSVQDIMDCSHQFGNIGCFGGGLMSNSFRYATERGVHEEKDYPYLAKDQPCRKIQGKKWTIGSYVGDYQGCDILMEGLRRGPVSVGVDASNFFSYKEGIFNKCGNSPNSGSLVVGVTDSYWLLKESLGTRFGENGFIRIAPGNSCAVCQLVSYPLLLI